MREDVWLRPLREGVTCDWYVVKLEGESPLRALVRRTVREGNGVHREVESEESRIQNKEFKVTKKILQEEAFNKRREETKSGNLFRKSFKRKCHWSFKTI